MARMSRVRAPRGKCFWEGRDRQASRKMAAARIYPVPTEMDREHWPRREARLQGPATEGADSIVCRPAAQATGSPIGALGTKFTGAFLTPGLRENGNVTGDRTQSRAHELTAWHTPAQPAQRHPAPW